MKRSTVPAGRIACVEWYDAEVHAIVLRSEEPSVIEFAHLAVYHETSPDNCQIWSYRASLQIFELRKFELEGASGQADYISDLTASGEAGSLTAGLIDTGERLAVERIEIFFGSGRKINIECRHVQLVIGQPVEHVEDWKGPLVSPRLPV